MLSALYQDEDILVIDKPSGLPSQPGEGVRVSVVEAVERDFGFRPFLVHRLDKETSGCLVVARDARAAGKWTRLIESRELKKTYRAIVAGVPEGRSGLFSDAVPTRGGEKSAQTAWKLIGSFGADAAAADRRAPSAEGRSEGAAASAAPRFSYLELELGTGRMHQIRLHLASHGLPILGDDKHGDFRLNKELRKEAALKRLCLVSWSLELPGGRRLTASLPEHFGAFFARFPDAAPEWSGSASATSGEPAASPNATEAR